MDAAKGFFQPDDLVYARRNQMRRLLLPVFLNAALWPQIIQASSEPILFIFDASGSMSEPFQGVTRMKAARFMLKEQITHLPLGTRVGLVAYGNGIPGCDSHRLYAPIARSSTGTIVREIDKMQAAGETPIAATLRQVGKSILAKEKSARIILISDGKESCGGDPAAEAALLRARGFNVFVIGLGVDDATAIDLRKIAGAGGGQYFHVQTNTEFIRAIELSTDTSSSQDDSGKEVTLPTKPPAIVTPAAPSVSSNVEMPDKDGIYLRGVRTSNLPDGRIKVEIDYTFKWIPRGDYMLTMQIFPGRRSQVPDGAASAVHYDSDHGSGTMVIELDPGEASGDSPIIVGELWDIGEAPVRVSRAVAP